MEPTSSSLLKIEGDNDDVPGTTSSSNPADDDLALPRTTVYKMITEMLPSGVGAPKETRELLLLCCTEFIHLLSSESNDICDKSGKKTISPEHVMEALKNLGFGSYIDEVKTSLEEFHTLNKEKEKLKASKESVAINLTKEELQKQQEELFEKARQRYQQAQKEALQSNNSSESSK